MFERKLLLAASLVALMTGACPVTGGIPAAPHYTNTIGMRFVRVEPGVFRMGQIETPLPWELLPVTGGRGDRMDSLRDGDWDERPVHEVQISKPFYLGIFEVSNFEYERFDPSHAAWRGREGISTNDHDAVIYVSWYEAKAFCDWLSDKENLPYRLPTEAEWEYACRAGTSDHYHTGRVLPDVFFKHQSETKGPVAVNLRVGQVPPNPWGAFDMHGNVEEWCMDWYGAYATDRQIDPVGYATGEFRVTRGGSFGTQVYHLRSANRLGALPETRNWITGFRVVLGELPGTEALPPPPLPLHQQRVMQREGKEVSQGPDPEQPYFKGPRKYVHIPNGSNGPLFASHNHDPAIVGCPNGDLLAVWYTCDSERNRELGQAASRLRWGMEEWDPASAFFDVPDRNDHAPAMGFDGRETIYFFTGVSFAGEHGAMALAMRTSNDSGATWSRARLVMPEFNHDHMPSEPVLWLRDGTLTFAQDGPRTLWMSRDGGVQWFNPGGRIMGNHPSVVELADGSLLGLGRGNAINGKMPQSISRDGGRSFDYSASEFPPIGGGQRLVLLRLREGPLFFASFADEGFDIRDQSGRERRGRGLFVAISMDEGRTWPHKRLVTDDGPGRAVEGSGGRYFAMSGGNAESSGYLAGCQGSDGVIHLISSRQHYAFDLKWALTPPPPLREPTPVQAAVETFEGPDFDATGWGIRKSFAGGFVGEGRYRIHSFSRSCGLNRMVGRGSFETTVRVSNLQFHPGGGRTTPGFILSLSGSGGGGVTVRLEEDQLRLGEDAKEGVRFDKPPQSAQLRIVYREPDRRCRVYYAMDGEEGTRELPESRRGLFLSEPFTENTILSLVQDHGSVELDHFELRPL